MELDGKEMDSMDAPALARLASAAGFALLLLLMPLGMLVFASGHASVYSLPKAAVCVWFSTLLTACAVVLFFQRKCLIPMAVLRLAAAGVISSVAWGLATAMSMDPALSFFGSHNRAMGLIFLIPVSFLPMLTALFLSTRRRAVAAFWMVLMSASVMSAYSLLQALRFDPLLDAQSLSVMLERFRGRSWGFAGNPDFSAPVCAVGFLLAAAVFAGRVCGRLWLSSLFPLALALINFAAVVQTTTRAAWVGSAVGGMILFVVAVKSSSSFFLKSAVLKGAAVMFISVLIIFTVLAAATWSSPNSVAGRLASMFTLKSSSGLPSSRLVLWRDTVAMIASDIKERRLMGCGPECFLKAFQSHRSLEDAQTYHEANPDSPHSEYLSAMALAGPLGLLSFLFLLYAGFRGGVEGLACHGSNASWPLLGLVSAMACFAVDLVFSFQVPGTAVCLAFLIGVACASGWQSGARGVERIHCGVMMWTPRCAVLLLLVFCFVASWIFQRNWKADILVAKADAAFEAERPDDAMKLYSDAASAAPWMTQYQVYKILAAGALVMKSKSAGDVNGAQRVCDDALAIHAKLAARVQNPFESARLAASCCFAVGRVRQGMDFLEKACEVDPYVYSARWALALLWSERHKRTKDVESIKKCHENAAMAIRLLKYRPVFDGGGNFRQLLDMAFLSPAKGSFEKMADAYLDLDWVGVDRRGGGSSVFVASQRGVPERLATLSGNPQTRLRLEALAVFFDLVARMEGGLKPSRKEAQEVFDRFPASSMAEVLSDCYSKRMTERVSSCGTP